VATYSPLKHWGVQKGSHVGVVGVGGLGHLACKLAKAMGAEVTAFTSSRSKLDATAHLGIDVVLSTDTDTLQKRHSNFDLILSTIPSSHDINPFVDLLRRDGTVVVIGALEPLEPVDNRELALHRKNVAGSLIGNLAETQEVLDFCAQHRIEPDIEMIDIRDINAAFERVVHGEVRFRYVINMASLQRG
jgi:alcohol dehydrogenase (NADP+)